MTALLRSFRNHKNKIVTKLNRGISQMAKARGVEVLCGEASFLSNQELYSAHSSITYILLILWIITGFIGYKVKNHTHRKNITIFLQQEV